MKTSRWMVACALTLTLSVGCAPGDDATVAGASDAVETPTVTFAADWSQRVTGALRANSPVRVSYDPARLTACRGEMYGRAAWGITGFYRVNDGEPQSFAVTDNGAAVTATITLPANPGAVEFWFQNNNRWGCNAYDSAYGQNYRFTFAPAANAPGWIGNGAAVISRASCDGHACDGDRRQLAVPFRYETWARQRAAVRVVTFDVWKEGVTDRDNPDLWRQLDVRMYRRFGASGEFTFSHVNFVRRVGNDARYELDLRTVDPMPDFPMTSECPGGLVESADPALVETTMEFYFTVNGVEFRPDGGGSFRAVFANYRTSVPSRCLPR
ncbi:MAG: DUF6209 family protein [Polyangiales bacterium]